MQSINNYFPDNLYHSYLVEGDESFVLPLLKKFLLEKNYIKENSPDLFIEVYESFTMDNIEVVKEWHSGKSLEEGGRRFCIISSKFINHDAERTLLKILEEPKEGTHFFIITPDVSILLDTIRSRTHTIKIKSENDVEQANIFLNLKPKDRMDFVKDFIESHKSDETSSGVRHEAINILNGLEKIFYDKWKSDLNNKDYQFILKEIKDNRGFLSTSGASVKMILEHIGLII